MVAQIINHTPFLCSGLVPEPAGQVAAAGEDGGGAAGAARLPAGRAEGGAGAGRGHGALAGRPAPLHPQPRPPRLPGTPPGTHRHRWLRVEVISPLQTPYASYLPGAGGLVTMPPCFPPPAPAPPPATPPTASSASSPGTAAPTSPSASDGRISPGQYYYQYCHVTVCIRYYPRLRAPGHLDGLEPAGRRPGPRAALPGGGGGGAQAVQHQHPQTQGQGADGHLQGELLQPLSRASRQCSNSSEQ